MNKDNLARFAKLCLAVGVLIVLAGCSNSPVQDPLWFLNPNGPIARASIFYLVVDVLLLSIVIVPATVLVIWTFWRYRRGGTGKYDPTFNHSIPIEVIVWGVPLLVVASSTIAPANTDAMNSSRIVADARTCWSVRR